MHKNTKQQHNVFSIFNDFDAFASGTPTCNGPKVNDSDTAAALLSNIYQPEYPPFSNFFPDPSPLPMPEKNMHIRTLPQNTYALENDNHNGADTVMVDAANETSVPKIPSKTPTVQLQLPAPKKKKKQHDATTSSKKQAPVSKPTIVIPQATVTTTDKDIISVHIKPARKTRSSYVSFFPDKLYCTPYKYDVRLLLGENADHALYTNFLNTSGEQHLVFKLLDGETRKQLRSNSKGEAALIVEKCKKQDEEEDEEEDAFQHDERTQVAYRLCFTVCSFHNYRRPFIIQCSDKSTGLVLFESNAFHIYARKNNKDKNGQSVNADAWGDEVPAEPVKILFSHTLPCTVSQASADDEEQQPLKQLNKRKRESRDSDDDDDDDNASVTSNDDPEEKVTVHRAKRQKVAPAKTVEQQKDAISELEEFASM